jgi:TPR repeat protein
MNCSVFWRRHTPSLCAISATAMLFTAAATVPAAALSPQANQQAVQYQIRHDWASLAALAAQAAAADPKDGWAWFYSGLADDGLDKKADAVKAYETALPLLTSYAQQNVIQLLATDYAALGEDAKLVALYQAATKNNPALAMSLRSQFPTQVAKALPSPSPAVLPDISSNTIAALTSGLRQRWQRDAEPVMIQVRFDPGQFGGGTYSWSVDYYSPATRTGLTVLKGPTGASTLPAADPNWGTAAIPDDFLSLAQAVARVPGAGRPDGLQSATLYHLSDDVENVSNLEWDMDVEGLPLGARVAAYILSKSELARMIAAAQSGNGRSQYNLALAYATGVVDNSFNAKASLYWLDKAASQGYAQAENKLGQYYQFGLGVGTDPAKAASWYQKATNAGFAPAEFNLGLLYETGLGVHQDWIEADKWITAAAKQGLQAAYAEMTMVRNAARRELHAEQLAASQRAAASARRPFIPVAPAFHTQQYYAFHNAHPAAPEQDGPPY